MYDCIIIGGGPAGMTSALYALRDNLSVLVLEAVSYGGQIATSPIVENYPGIKSINGFDFATNLYNQIMELGCVFKIERVLSIDEELNVKTENNTYKGKSIIIATGLTNRQLGLENEKKLIGKGISYCASCDGNFYKDKDVVVVGGGNTALEDVLYLSNIAKHVTLVHHSTNFRAFTNYVEDAYKRENVKIITNASVVEINGIDDLESIDILVGDTKINQKTDGLFIAIGKIPQNEIFKNVVDLTDDGYIDTKDGVHTNIEHIYVAGDARKKELKQLTTAVADGAVAAYTAIKEITY